MMENMEKEGNMEEKAKQTQETESKSGTQKKSSESVNLEGDDVMEKEIALNENVVLLFSREGPDLFYLFCKKCSSADCEHIKTVRITNDKLKEMQLFLLQEYFRDSVKLWSDNLKEYQETLKGILEWNSQTFDGYSVLSNEAGKSGKSVWNDTVRLELEIPAKWYKKIEAISELRGKPPLAVIKEYVRFELVSDISQMTDDAMEYIEEQIGARPEE